MKYFVYILFSQKFHRTYVGQTGNLENRLSCHNNGRVRSTKNYRPWLLFYHEGYETRSEAMKREKWYKSSSGRKFIAELVLKKETSGLFVSSR